MPDTELGIIRFVSELRAKVSGVKLIDKQINICPFSLHLLVICHVLDIVLGTVDTGMNKTEAWPTWKKGLKNIISGHKCPEEK